MEENSRLKRAMAEAGCTQAELVDALNDCLIRSGHRATVSDRTVRYWLTGRSRWPHRRLRDALEHVFGCQVADLGFTPSGALLLRRSFLASTAAVAVSTSPGSSPDRVGSSDVAALRQNLDSLTGLDHRRGGHLDLEQAALAGSRDCLDRTDRARSQRIRKALLSLAADFTATAAWSSIDARHLDRADDLLREALLLARLAGDSGTEMRVWNSLAMVAHQRRDHTAAVDAGYAAQATAVTRRDPLFGSLAHARTAIGHAHRGDPQAALRSLGFAETLLAKASPEQERPPWIGFYGPAELHALSAIVRDQIGHFDEAEAASHRALAVLPGQFRRNRALVAARLALAQVHQGEAEQACATSEQVFHLMDGAPLPGRMRTLMSDLHGELMSLAPDSDFTREWVQRYRDEWSRCD
ncbi:XRE family transcriptional regulator [Streptomyces genisteinicus]|uniref:XRE family transcriptional regulator n=1 Tax=Streptomyces genisteinicus TaxID=2768068 RepID=UPI001FE9C492|nr:XRE family transcriptional regulator [Streptomyces genisteinicus]